MRLEIDIETGNEGNRLTKFEVMNIVQNKLIASVNLSYEIFSREAPLWGCLTYSHGNIVFFLILT